MKLGLNQIPPDFRAETFTKDLWRHFQFNSTLQQIISHNHMIIVIEFRNRTLSDSLILPDTRPSSQ